MRRPAAAQRARRADRGKSPARRARRISAIVAILAALSGGAAVAGAEASPRELRVAIAYSVPTGSPLDKGWTIDPKMRLARRPTLADLEKADPALARDDLGLSFDCEATPRGELADCRPDLVIPETRDPSAAIRALSRLIRVDGPTAALARAKGYRVTIDAALAVFPPPFVMPPPCVGQFCYRDPPPPPPPLPAAKDPVFAFAIERAHRCYDTAWEAASQATFAARAVLHDPAMPTTSDAYRRLALDAVTRRQAVGSCLARLKHVNETVPGTVEDGKACDARFQSMLTGYRDLAPGVLAVLSGLLDRRTATREEAFPF